MLSENIRARIDFTSECWLWTGRIDRHGYGRFSGGRLAHRVVYEALAGPIPDGLTIDHLCRVKHCVNPDHLEPVTNAENIRRGVAATKTHCVNGHEFTRENTYVRSGDGRRNCRECVRAAGRSYRARKRATAC